MRLNALLSLVLSGLFFLLPANASAKAGFSSIKNPRSVAGAQSSDPITQNNWRRHPKIKTIRQVVESVNAGIRKSIFKTSKRVFEYCEPYEDTLRKIAVDSSGLVRRYEKQGGSEDSSLTWEHYYDSAGRLRFVFISGGAANGARLEHRIYFDEGSQRIWESHKYTKGPEYTFPEVWPDDQLQKADPANAFKADSKCLETKGPAPTKVVLIISTRIRAREFSLSAAFNRHLGSDEPLRLTRFSLLDSSRFHELSSPHHHQ
jgi:hypothetical protein